MPDRVLGALIVDPLGAVGDGGIEEFWDTQLSRLTAEGRRRVEEIEGLESAGTVTAADEEESNRLVWPTYFADSNQTSPFALRSAGATHRPIQAEVFRDMPMLAPTAPFPGRRQTGHPGVVGYDGSKLGTESQPAARPA